MTAYMPQPKFKVGDIIELIDPQLFDYDEPTIRKVEAVNTINYRYEISYETTSGLAKVYTTDNISVVDRMYQLKTELVPGNNKDRCDCGALKAYNSMDKHYHSFWCKSQGKR